MKLNLNQPEACSLQLEAQSPLRVNHPMVVDVIILSFCKDQTHFRLNNQCISSLIASEEKIHFNILMVESNPDWDQFRFQYDFPVTIIQPKEPFHYNRFLNAGLKQATAELVVFSNNDVVFHPGWLSSILNVRKINPRIRSFCPFDRTSPYLDWAQFNRKEYHIGYRVPIEFVGWCFVVERSVFEATGNFDEQFDLYFQDNDFANTLEKHNILNALVPSSFVQHVGGYTTGVKDASITEKYRQDKATFLAKWGKPTLLKRLLRIMKRRYYNF